MFRSARILALFFVAGLASIASAADMPVKAPVIKAPVATSYDWTGIYLGANVGYGVARDIGNFTNKILSPAVPPTTETFNFSPAGFIGGGQLGFNWQFDPHWLIGFEADIHGSGQDDHFTCILNCLNIPAIGELNGTTVEQKLKWFGTARVRFGWTNGPVLWYATGGLAYGQLDTDINTVQQTGTPVRYSFSDTKTGWTAGGGVEVRLAGPWSAKAEYLYLDLGSVSHSFLYTANNTLVGFPTSNAYTSAIRDHIIRAGLNYNFGWEEQQAAAAAYPLVTGTANWTGFYVGVNTGYGVARNPTSQTGIFNTTGTPVANEDYYLMPRGVIGGGQIGYNWQFTSQWVLGLEADIQASGQKDDSTCADFCDPTPGGGISEVAQKLPWFGTARGRLGVVFGPALFYATGGAAFGEVETNINQSNFNGIPLVLKPFDFSHGKAGWTVGGGIESHIAGNWSAKLEYLYIDLGTVSDTYVNPIPPNPFATTFMISSKIRDNVVRLGLNYKFGRP
jgi:outer membrane immunogenic protein